MSRWFWGWFAPQISEARFDVQKNAKFFKQNIFLFYLEKNFTKGYNGLD